MSRVLLLTIALLGVAFAGSPGDKPDFTGDWTLNLDKSNFGKAPKPTGMTLKVARDGDVMRAVQTTNSDAGPTDIQSEWIMDGKEHGSATEKSLTRWEGNTLYSEHRANDGTYTLRIWLSLSADGKTATEKVLSKTADGENVGRLVWERR